MLDFNILSSSVHVLLRCIYSQPFKAWWSIRLANCSLAFVLITAFGSWNGWIGRILVAGWESMAFISLVTHFKARLGLEYSRSGVFHGLFIARYPEGHQVQMLCTKIFK